MSHRFTLAVAASVAILMSGQALAQSGTACKQLPEIKKALDHFDGKKADRERAQWQVAQADKLCKDGKPDEAKSYLDLAHSLVLKDHKH
ncbi:MAG: hypothetical protein EPN20_05025 [Magnetospirillum sp.]|nr:MAG: hypothetical protein EPN20_05025 [Magnetospirillum sp.]